MSKPDNNTALSDEHKRIPDWGWLTETLNDFDITEKRTMRKNARDFTSLEAHLYTEIQKRYTPREKPHRIVSDGHTTSKELEDAKRIHPKQIELMDKMGYGLMLDGFTFYKYGHELQPYEFERTFTMHHAYEIYSFFQERSTARVVEELKRVEESNPGYHLEYEYEDGALTHLSNRISELESNTEEGES